MLAETLFGHEQRRRPCVNVWNACWSSAKAYRRSSWQTFCGCLADLCVKEGHSQKRIVGVVTGAASQPETASGKVLQNLC